MINVAVLGYGVVGSGVVEVLKKNSNSISERAKDDVAVKKILDIRDFSESPDKDLFTKNPEEIFNDPEIQIVVETIGGAGVAYEFTKAALTNKKHVVTSNKELVATHGPELLQLARDNEVNYLFEASVGGGIPIIRPLNQCLAANEIYEICGILNGTTNYILTQMKKEEKDFSDALKGAQKNGYAEANPTADIEGHDACRKIAILSSIAFDEFVDYKNIYTEGITNITLNDMEYAEAINSVVKLIAISKKHDEKIFARVSPALVSKDNPLANVEDVFNAIVVKGNALGDAMFYGRGAGKLPTASAVVADVIDVAKHLNNSGRYLWTRKPYNNVMDINDCESRFLVRIGTNNREAAKEEIRKIFGDIDFIILEKKGLEQELAFTTNVETESKFKEKLKKIQTFGCIGTVINTIRIIDN